MSVSMHTVNSFIWPSQSRYFVRFTSECTDAPCAVCEMTLAHRVGNAVSAAYIRGDQFERRAGLMQDWTAYVVVSSWPACLVRRFLNLKGSRSLDPPSASTLGR